MPLRDHFRPPLSKRNWESLHGQWSGCLAAYLNRTLPRRFVADLQVHLGRKVEADVVEFDQDSGTAPNNGPTDSGGGVAVATQPAVYTPPAAVMSVPLRFDDAIEIKIHDAERGQKLVAVVELVSPSNKDRPEERESFAIKSLSYLKTGVGLVVVDIVTDMHFNLHDELVRIGRAPDAFQMPGHPTTYAVAYRPIWREEAAQFDVWPHELRIGMTLPVVPLSLLGYGCVRLDLEATYTEACERNRIP